MRYAKSVARVNTYVATIAYRGGQQVLRLRAFDGAAALLAVAELAALRSWDVVAVDLGRQGDARLEQLPYGARAGSISVANSSRQRGWHVER